MGQRSCCLFALFQRCTAQTLFCFPQLAAAFYWMFCEVVPVIPKLRNFQIERKTNQTESCCSASPTTPAMLREPKKSLGATVHPTPLGTRLSGNKDMRSANQHPSFASPGRSLLVSKQMPCASSWCLVQQCAIPWESNPIRTTPLTANVKRPENQLSCPQRKINLTSPVPSSDVCLDPHP